MNKACANPNKKGKKLQNLKKTKPAETDLHIVKT